MPRPTPSRARRWGPEIAHRLPGRGNPARKYPFARFYLQARQQQGCRLKTHACEARHNRPHRNTAHLPDESGGRNGRFQRRLAGSAPRRNDGSQQGPPTAHTAAVNTVDQASTGTEAEPSSSRYTRKSLRPTLPAMPECTGKSPLLQSAEQFARAPAPEHASGPVCGHVR